MVWLTVLVTGFTVLLFSAALCMAQSSNNNVDITSLNEHVKKIDAVLQEVQTHSQAQEQKYSAVLSSVLSQLTQTTEELSASKNVTEELRHELQELSEYKNVSEKLQLTVENMAEELKNLKEINNKTQLDYMAAMEELAELKQYQNHSQIELEMVKSDFSYLHENMDICPVQVSQVEIPGQRNTSGSSHLNGSKRPWICSDIGFEAYLDQTTTISSSGRIVFDQVHHNNGNGYNKTTGYFTAPVSGTYLLWTNLVYYCPDPVVFRIETEKKTLGFAYGEGCEKTQPMSATTVFYLRQGQRTWISHSKMVTLQPDYPSAGALLIKRN